MYSELLKKAWRLRCKGAEDYRRLHKIAEEGLQLPKTLELVKGRLRELGYAPKELAGGVLVCIGQGERCVLLRADMDALPIKEETGLECASENGNMHACGHDMHTAMLIGAASLLKEREKELSGRVMLCFQPGEETLEGAKRMLEAGLLEKERPDCAVMLHVLTATEHETGTVIIPPEGVGASGADFFRVTVLGNGCHGSTPHLGRDPIAAMSAIIACLSSLTAKELKGGEGDVITVGQVRAGDRANVIPDKGEFFGTLRSYSDENREYIKTRLKEICEWTAAAYRCKANVEFTSGAPSFINDPSVRERTIKILEKGEIPPYIVPQGAKGGGSEDFSYVSRRVPSIMLCLAAGNRAEGYTEPLHSPGVRFDETAIPYGAAVYAAMAIGLLESYR